MTDVTAPIHASVFSHQGSGCMLIGASGTGKSKLVADAMGMGAKLVGDDQVILFEMMGLLAAGPVPELQGVLELRPLGLIKINDVLTKHVIHLIVELDPAADARLPEVGQREYFGIKVPYLRVPPVPHTTANALIMYMRAMQENRVLPTDWMPKAV